MSCWYCVRRERLVCVPAMKLSGKDSSKFRPFTARDISQKRPTGIPYLYGLYRSSSRWRPRVQASVSCPSKQTVFFIFWHPPASTRNIPQQRGAGCDTTVPSIDSACVSLIVATPCGYCRTRARSLKNRESAPRTGTEDRKSKHFC